MSIRIIIPSLLCILRILFLFIPFLLLLALLPLLLLLLLFLLTFLILFLLEVLLTVLLLSFRVVSFFFCLYLALIFGNFGLLLRYRLWLLCLSLTLLRRLQVLLSIFRPHPARILLLLCGLLRLTRR